MTTPLQSFLGTARNHEANAAVWMQQNPLAMATFLQFARFAHSKGVKIGIALLVERVRWHGRVEHGDAEGYKINNNHRAYIARELIRQCPELRDVFELRRAGDESDRMIPTSDRIPRNPTPCP